MLCSTLHQGSTCPPATLTDRFFLRFSRSFSGHLMVMFLLPVIALRRGSLCLRAMFLSPVVGLRRSSLHLLLMLLFPVIVFCQPSGLPVNWDRTLGGPVNDVLRAAVATADDGWLIGGYSFQGSEGGSAGSESRDDFKVMKLDREGHLQWTRNFHADKTNFLTAILASPDGGFLLGGYSMSGAGEDKSEDSRGGYDYWIIKINSNGDKLWDKTFGGTGMDQLYSICSDGANGYILGGTSDSEAGSEKSEDCSGSLDYWLLHINENGDKVWDKTIGGTDVDNFRRIIRVEGGGYLAAGYSQSQAGGGKTSGNNGFYDYWICRLDEDGNLLWDKSYGGSSLDQMTAVIATADGGYLLGGDSYSRPGGDKSGPLRGFNDYWIVRIDRDGNRLWDQTYGGSSSEYFNAIISTDSGFLLGGSSSSLVSGNKTSGNKGESDYWILEIDEAGTAAWDRTYGGRGSELLSEIIPFRDGYLLAGQSNSGAGGDKTESALGSTDFWVISFGQSRQKENQSITVENIPDQVYGNDDILISAVASSGLPLQFKVISGSVTINDSRITINGAGPVTIEVSQEGNETYYPAEAVRLSFLVNKADPVIVWEPASPMKEQRVGVNQLNAKAFFRGSSLNGRFQYYPGEGSWFDPGIYTLFATFEPEDSENFNTIYNTTRQLNVLDPEPECDPLLITLQKLKVFPNPFTDRMTITFSDKTIRRINATLLDMNGRIAWSANNLIPGTPLNFGSALKPGSYLLRLTWDKKVQTLIVIKSGLFNKSLWR